MGRHTRTKSKADREEVLSNRCTLVQRVAVGQHVYRTRVATRTDRDGGYRGDWQKNRGFYVWVAGKNVRIGHERLGPNSESDDLRIGAGGEKERK
jgi:hypothetical protein